MVANPLKPLWFNPTIGEAMAGPEIAGGRRHALRAPFPGAAVLYLRKVD
jgi:hypothetical protein